MRINAFTLVEVLVSLVISSIILAFAWNVYFYMDDYRGLIENKAEEQITLKKIEYWMNRDMSEASEVRFDEGSLTIIKPDDSISYEFKIDHLIRSNMVSVDSVNIAARLHGFRPLERFQVCLQYQNSDDYCFSLSLPESSFRYLNSKNENP